MCRELQISEQTYYRWPNQYGGLKADEPAAISLSRGAHSGDPSQRYAEDLLRMVGGSAGEAHRVSTHSLPATSRYFTTRHA